MRGWLLGSITALSAVGCAAARPAAGQLVLHDRENGVTLEVGGWIQTRYEYADERAADGLGRATAGFFLRRARLDIRGTLRTPRLTFRLQPEFARTPNLRDGYFELLLSPSLALRLGQFPVPFQWRVSPRRQQLAERGAATGTFSHPTTRDVGLLLRGDAGAGRMEWDLGLFGGAGANAPRSPTRGHLAAARVHLSIFGPLPRKESDEGRTARTLAVGAGLLAAASNELEDWSLGRSTTGAGRADWVAGVLDGQLQLRGFTASASLYRRGVSPSAPDVSAYSGWGAELSAGYAVLVDRLELVGQLSRAEPDEADVGTWVTSRAVAVTWYSRGHDLKTRAQYTATRPNEDVGPEGHRRVLTVEAQVLF